MAENGYLPLDDLVVLDLARVRAGPTAVRQLADWGADVIKIETPPSPGQAEGPGGARHGPDFQNLQRNKRAINLNLKSDEGREIFFRLVETADIVIENYRPGVKHRLGIDYEAARAVNPRVIYGSISGFGQSGPYRERPGVDQIAQGMGGLMSITGEAGRGPMRVGIPVADLTAGLFCAMGILVALIERAGSGKGQWIQTSLLQAQAFMLDFQAARYLMEGVVPGQAGNDHPTSFPTSVFPTSDGHINIGAAGEVIWRRLCEALNTVEWVSDRRFEANDKRSQNRVELHALISERTKRKPSAKWLSIFANAGVASGPIYDMEGLFADPQVQHLGVAEAIDTSCFGETRMMAQPFALSRTPSRLAVAPPERGQQTDEILAALGISDDEIKDLRARRII
ncbi:MAG: CoA transferase [Chloroflexota bacterium]|nr:CoA transferase [Chloroflexota bacterium]